MIYAKFSWIYWYLWPRNKDFSHVKGFQYNEQGNLQMQCIVCTCIFCTLSLLIDFCFKSRNQSVNTMYKIYMQHIHPAYHYDVTNVLLVVFFFFFICSVDKCSFCDYISYIPHFFFRCTRKVFFFFFFFIVVGKAPGPSGIVVEMIRAAGDMGTSMIRDLAAAIIRNGKVPSEWEQSFIVCLYKGKGDALVRGNYRSLKLTEQVMKIQERIVDGLIRQLVSIDDSQFGFVPGKDTTDAIFVVRQLQEKYLAANKRLYMAFVDPEKALMEYLRRSSGGRWENLVWRSGLCDWCRGCMQMREALSVLV